MTGLEMNVKLVLGIEAVRSKPKINPLFPSSSVRGDLEDYLQSRS